MKETYDQLIEKYYSLRNRSNVSQLTFQERIELSDEIYQSIEERGINLFRRILPKVNEQENPKNLSSYSYNIINLGSNDYLNLTKHPEVIEQSNSVSTEMGIGAGSVPMLMGTSTFHKQLEKRIAEFLQTENCLTYNSCYAANIGLLDALLKPGDIAILDNLVHASIINGCQNANHGFFLHNDLDSLNSTLKKFKSYKNKLIVIEGVYSMDGDRAPLNEIIDIANTNRAMLMIDEAHSIGVIGYKGKGIRFTGNYPSVMGGEVITGSFGKGLPGVGGFVSGSNKLINYLYFMSRPFLFSTALPPNIAASLITALDLIENDPTILNKLNENIKQFSNGIEELGLNINQSDSAIFPWIIRDEKKVITATKNPQKTHFFPMISIVTFVNESSNSTHRKFSIRYKP